VLALAVDVRNATRGGLVSILWIILIVVLVLALLGFFGFSRR
jgi:flagellar basal body-associated protein FliL